MDFDIFNERSEYSDQKSLLSALLIPYIIYIVLLILEPFIKFKKISIRKSAGTANPQSSLTICTRENNRDGRLRNGRKNREEDDKRRDKA